MAGAITTLSGVDLNNYKTVTKDYYADATCTNLPSTGAGGGHLRTTFKTSSNAIQFFIGLINSCPPSPPLPWLVDIPPTILKGKHI